MSIRTQRVPPVKHLHRKKKNVHSHFLLKDPGVIFPGNIPRENNAISLGLHFLCNYCGIWSSIYWFPLKNSSVNKSSVCFYHVEFFCGPTISFVHNYRLFTYISNTEEQREREREFTKLCIRKQVIGKQTCVNKAIICSIL